MLKVILLPCRDANQYGYLNNKNVYKESRLSIYTPVIGIAMPIITMYLNGDSYF